MARTIPLGSGDTVNSQTVKRNDELQMGLGRSQLCQIYLEIAYRIN